MSSRHDTLFRYIALLQLIPRAPQFKATSTLQIQLEERGFSVELRSIQRYLDRLATSFPILCNKKEKPYRWSFDPAFKSNLPAMDTPTALTLVMAEEHLTGLLPKVAVDQLVTQFQTARKHLESLAENRLAGWAGRVRAIPNGKALIPAQIAPQTWKLVTDALLSHYPIEVSYLSRHRNEPREYVLHPQGLVTRHSATYLLAMVNDYEDIRQFALHRIQSMAISSQAYRAKTGFNLDDYIAEGAFGYPVEEGGVQLKAHIRSDIARVLSETPVSHQQQIQNTEDDNWKLLQAEVPNDQQTQWWLQGFGADVDVLEPSHWREVILQQAREIVSRAEAEQKFSQSDSRSLIQEPMT